MSMDAPNPPDPNALAQQQQQYNLQAAENQQSVNDVNQVTPYGSLTYTQTGKNDNGVPIMTANTQYNPQVQSMFDQFIKNQTGLGGIAGNIIKNQGGAMGSAPNLNIQPLTQQMMQWGQQYMQPIFNQQQSNLNSQLAAQGISQGSDAYNNAQNLQSRNVNNAYENLFMQAEPTAFNQALTQYELPFQNVASLLGLSQPGSLNSSLTQTPQAQVAPANYEGLAEQQYGQQQQNYENTLAGIFGIGSAVAGGLGRMIPFPSDERIKENISRVGTLDNGLPIYVFNYKTDPDGIPQIGLMAQDVERLHPEAVVNIDGIKHVRYAMAVK